MSRPRLLAVFGEYAYGDPARGPGYEYVNFLPAFRRLGYEVRLFDSFRRDLYADFADLNRRLLETVEREDPEVIFCVLMGYEVWRETLDLIRRGTRATLIHWGTDDSWKYAQFTRLVAPAFHLHATTYPSALERAHRDGLENVVLSQWAADAGRLAEPLPARRCRYPVSFVGAAYGNRRRWIRALARRGIEVACFGHGWPAGPVSRERLEEILRGSLVSLNLADSGLQFRGPLPYRDRQIKARVFEVPGAGGLLATQAAPGLERWLRPGREMVVFRHPGEAAREIRALLDHPDRRDAIARAGHLRVAAEHTYDQRLRALLDVAQERADPHPDPGGVDWSTFAAAVARHRTGPGLRLLGRALRAPMTLAFGPRRGPRAARRLLFELSWRLAGAHTYSTAGWPGRLFYRES